MKVTLYGIKGCAMTRQARAWLDDYDIPCALHDYKAAGLDAGNLDTWLALHSWDALLNSTALAFRKLPADFKSDLDEAKARRLMLTNPSLVKRPVLEAAGEVTVGFSPEGYAALFGK